MMQKTQWDMDWELLEKPHMQRVTKHVKSDLSDRIKAFPLSHIVEKCYSYDPLNILGQSVWKHL